MRTDLSHLPAEKRAELALAVAILTEEFERRRGWGKVGRILKIILYGSYARGDWVDDEESGYKSDYDLLVVVDLPELTDYVDYWETAEEALDNRIDTPVNFIVHSLEDVQEQLGRGRYFFIDILEQGIALHDTTDQPFVEPRMLDAQVAKEEAQDFFDEWFTSASDFLDNSYGSRDRGRLKNAAFLLHQAAERYYSCLLLVTSLYTPHTHKLNFLRSLSEAIDRQLIAAWPRDTKLARARFELLRRAYIEARYSPHYKISQEELEWLAERIEQLRALVEAACRRHLARPLADFTYQRRRPPRRNRKKLGRLWEDKA